MCPPGSSLLPEEVTPPRAGLFHPPDVSLVRTQLTESLCSRAVTFALWLLCCSGSHCFHSSICGTGPPANNSWGGASGDTRTPVPWSRKRHSGPRALRLCPLILRGKLSPEKLQPANHGTAAPAHSTVEGDLLLRTPRSRVEEGHPEPSPDPRPPGLNQWCLNAGPGDLSQVHTAEVCICVCLSVVEVIGYEKNSLKDKEMKGLLIMVFL